jgi:anti-sigma factor RsiW
MNMGPCEEKNMLAAYLDDELIAADRARLEQHLRTCATCSAELTSMREAAGALRRFRDESLTAGQQRDLHRAIDSAAADDARLMRFVATVGVLAASILLVGLLWLRMLAAPQPPTQGDLVSAPHLEPWEQTAVTLRPDPTLLPTDPSQTQRMAENDLADWMLQGLNQKADR